MKSAQKLIGILAIALVFTTVGCDDDESTNPGTSSGFTISGTIEIAKQIDVPANAELYAVWSVSSGSPDYAYAFGKGTVDMDAGTFSITFDNPPPMVALNDFYHPSRDTIPMFGVAFLCLSDEIVEDSVMYDNAPGIYGVVAEAAVIYIDGEPELFEIAGHRPWLSDFPKGYGFGKRKVNGPNTFDSIIPADLNSMKLIISDDWADYKIPNWT